MSSLLKVLVWTTTEKATGWQVFTPFQAGGLYYFVFESLCVWVLLFMQLQGLLCCHTVSFISLHLTSLSDRSLPCHILQLQDTKDRISKTLAISRKPWNFDFSVTIFVVVIRYVSRGHWLIALTCQHYTWHRIQDKGSWKGFYRGLSNVVQCMWLTYHLLSGLTEAA